MLLGLVVIVALVNAHLVMVWKAYRERTAKWKLYALRDRLRWAAINDQAVLESPLFSRVDAALTALAGNLHEISLWLLLPLLWESKSPEREKAEQEIALLLSRDENAPIKPVIVEATRVFAQHLACRHLFVTAGVVCSIVGYAYGKEFLRWLSRGIVTAVIQPPVPRPAIVGDTVVGRSRVA